MAWRMMLVRLGRAKLPLSGMRLSGSFALPFLSKRLSGSFALPFLSKRLSGSFALPFRADSHFAEMTRHPAGIFNRGEVP